MASIPQERYIKITTGKGSVDTLERNLQTLVFTDSTAEDGTVFDADSDVVCTDIAGVATAFGVGSKEYIWASKYFSFSNPLGSSPTTLKFAKVVAQGDESGEPEISDEEAAFARVSARTNDFGVFTFLTEITTAAINAIATANAALNYRFEFVYSMTLSELNLTYASEVKPVVAYQTACVGADGANGSHGVFQKEVDLDGSTIKVPKTYMLAAVLSSIDWNQTDGTVSPFFRSFNGEVADVDSSASVKIGGVYTSIGADDLDEANVNYYGKVQINGVGRSFYQRGVNSDGETALVYMGEVWLKSAIATRIMKLLLSVSKIKANSEGNAQVYTNIDAACSDGVDNGVIEVGKDLDETARASIFSSTRDAKAADIIVNRGYWLNTKIAKDNDGKNYKAKYLLLYSKGDVVVKVEGAQGLY